MSETIISNIVTDYIGQFIKLTPEFRGKWRLIRYWMNHHNYNTVKLRILPGGEKVFCHLSVPYESMVWLEREEQTDLRLLTKLLEPEQTFVPVKQTSTNLVENYAGALGRLNKKV
jgi:hypothetical protein